MTDRELITREVLAARSAGRGISHACARMIANHYQGGAMSATFAACGWIPVEQEQLWVELFPDYERLDRHGKRIADMMATYLSTYGPRAALVGWSHLRIKG